MYFDEDASKYIKQTSAETFCSKIKELRKKANLSQDEAAAELHISKASLSYYETANRVPDITVLSLFCKFYEVSADYLLGLEDIKEMDLTRRGACQYIGISESTLDSIKKLEEKTINDSITEDKYKPDITLLDKSKYTGYGEEYIDAFAINHNFLYYFELLCKHGIIDKLCEMLCQCNLYIDCQHNMAPDFALLEDVEHDHIKMKLFDFFTKIWNIIIPDLITEMLKSDIDASRNAEPKKAGG